LRSEPKLKRGYCVDIAGFMNLNRKVKRNVA
jgi:hypothetical protein